MGKLSGGYRGIAWCRFGIMLLLFVATGAQGEIVYKHVDDNGRVTFTDIPRVPGYVAIEVNPKAWSDPSRSLGLAIIQRRLVPYAGFVEAAADRYNLPAPLIQAVIAVESACDTYAVSRTGAMGLMQLMPDTAKRFGIENPFDPEENIRGGAQYLSLLMKLFNDDLSLVLAAYNAGEGAVQKYGNAIPPYPETENYVRKVRRFRSLLDLEEAKSLAQSG